VSCRRRGRGRKYWANALLEDLNASGDGGVEVVQEVKRVKVAVSLCRCVAVLL